MHIREADLSDFQAFKVLQKQFYDIYIQKQSNTMDYQLNSGQFESLLQDKKVFLVENDGEVMGYTILHIADFKNSNTVSIEEICIDEPHRGQGIGNFLFGKAVLFAKSINATGLDLRVWEFNQSAIHFYETMGMKTKTRKMELSL
jgi:diamine N-acetyltransferase